MTRFTHCRTDIRALGRATLVDWFEVTERQRCRCGHLIFDRAGVIYLCASLTNCSGSVWTLTLLNTRPLAEAVFARPFDVAGSTSGSATGGRCGALMFPPLLIHDNLVVLTHINEWELAPARFHHPMEDDRGLCPTRQCQ
jgi:hypothetical protein